MKKDGIPEKEIKAFRDAHRQKKLAEKKARGERRGPHRGGWRLHEVENDTLRTEDEIKQDMEGCRDYQKSALEGMALKDGYKIIFDIDEDCTDAIIAADGPPCNPEGCLITVNDQKLQADINQDRTAKIVPADAPPCNPKKLFDLVGLLTVSVEGVPRTSPVARGALT